MKKVVIRLLEQKLDYLVRRKKKLIYCLLIILFGSYFLPPFSLMFFPGWMNQAIYREGPSLIWVYTFLQIPFTWLLGWIYTYKRSEERLVGKGCVCGEST